ncbi:4-(cytidine 5'-diphospho)-2-C-methyl-D-erythritol kinase [Antarcticimicrobium luteum]|uniref:4-diphosphocytidyl-2-C-methyl-D-erythritol kinase n=1 Tax=Antarcticimicrobium luteum TaxID=2547397 RepID=A0A4R5UTF0_9RHOB|nr:4-(cytidine 5'-diphospho)-2-C-methyl-D-erythritol kinase [Antarcticimicrobium luteum]TDK42321.1 4-(cytidine 5'-diphospho)-2-C-methyl-D-erythritol kinase [Antarcticimicrobium luteum]
MATEAFAPAKINLTLHVTGQRADGYHLLDSLVVFAGLGDRLRFEPAGRMSLKVTGRFAAGVPEDGRNLVWRAAELAGVTLKIRLEKALPHGAGIGGGSSDAAAVLRTFGGQERAAELGADVPVCLAEAPQRMRGIGNELEAVPDVPAVPLVLVNPGDHVPTPEVFRALAQKQNPDMGALPRWSSQAEFLAWLAAQRNDLEAPAIAAAPAIRDALNGLGGAEGCLLARMSGSGATCFGIFGSDEAARAAAAQIAAAHPDWWVQPTRSIGSAGA